MTPKTIFLIAAVLAVALVPLGGAQARDGRDWHDRGHDNRWHSGHRASVAL